MKVGAEQPLWHFLRSHLYFLLSCLTQKMVSSMVTHCSSWEPALWQVVSWEKQLSAILCFILLLPVQLWSRQRLSWGVPWCPGAASSCLAAALGHQLMAALQSPQRVPCWTVPSGLHTYFCLADFIISTASPAQWQLLSSTNLQEHLDEPQMSLKITVHRTKWTPSKVEERSLSGLNLAYFCKVVP